MGNDITYDWRLHHGEVVAINADHGAILLAQQLLPTVGAKVGAVLEKPLHALGVVVLRLRSGVVGVLAHTIARPNEERGRRLERLFLHEHRDIFLERLDAVLEVWEEPAGCSAGAGAEQT